MEELDGLGDHILYPPAPGLVAHDQLGGAGKVIGDDIGGSLAAVAPNIHLPQLPLIVGQSDEGLMNDRAGVLALAVRDVDALLWRKRVDALYHRFRARLA